MKNTQMIRIGSNRALVALLDNMDTSEIPGLPEAAAAFVAEMNEVDALKRRQARRLEPALEVRNAAFATLETMVYQMAGQALSFAERKGNADLAAHMRLPSSAFHKRAFERRVSVAERVHDALVVALPALAGSGITAEKVAALQEAIAAARAQLAAPRYVVVDRSEATLLLEAKLRTVSRVVRNQLDPLFRPLRRTNPGLYHKYRAARKLINRPATREREEVEGPAPAGSTPAAPATATGVSTSANSPSNAEAKAAA